MALSKKARQDVLSKARDWIAEADEEFLTELIDTYLADTPERLADLRTGFECGDQESCTRSAHTIKSSSVYLGAVDFADLAKSVELASRAGRIKEMGDEVRQLESDYRQIKAVLENLKNTKFSELSPRT
jgi:HPt (histidine-containing phosphotransfer) domain-containing protein